MDKYKGHNVQVFLHANEVTNYIEALSVIEQSNDYMGHANAKQFDQFVIKKGLKEFPMEGKQYIIKEMDDITCQEVFGKVVYKSLPHDRRSGRYPPYYS